MTRKEWLATQTGKDPHAILKACVTRPVLSRTPQPDTQEPRPALEDQALRYLKTIRAEVGATWTKDTTPSDIKRDLDAWVAAGGSVAGIMQRINKLLPFWTMYYAIQDMDASDTVSVPQPDLVEYGKSPAEANGFPPYQDVFEVRKELEVMPR